MNMVTGEVIPLCVMVSRGWLGEEVGHWVSQVAWYCQYGKQGKSAHALHILCPPDADNNAARLGQDDISMVSVPGWVKGGS